MKAFSDFVLWESKSRDTIDFKKIYVDMAQGDIVAGLVLSEIVYWYLPDRNGKTKLRVEHGGQQWIAAPRNEWWDRCRITPRQSDRALRILKKEGLIATHVYKFNNSPTVHIRIVEECFIPTWDQHIIEPKQNPFLPDGENAPFNQMVKTVDLTNPLNLVTEITTETTISPDTPSAVSAPAPTAVKPPTPHQAMFQAVCDAWGYPVELLTKSKRGQIGSVTAELVGANAQPSQIPAFKEWLDDKAKAGAWGSYTVNAMKTYWPDYVAANPAPPEPTGEPGIDPLFDPTVEGLTFEELNRRKLERSIRQLEALRQSS